MTAATGTTDGRMTDIRAAIIAVVDGRELSQEEARAAMDDIMEGRATGAQIAALATALRLRGESVDEIAGFARAMRDHALRVDVPESIGPLVDTCGTGGDHSGSFNISTTASFVIAATGVAMAKHGNRAMSSICGSADLLEGLGVAVELTPEQVVRCICEVGIGFMYAPAFHPAMRFVGPTRREIGIRTIFNLLGPLTNPAGTRHQLIGVGQPGISRTLAEALAKLGCEHAVLVHADEGLDEVGIAGKTEVTDFNAATGAISVYDIVPEDLGLQSAPASSLRGGDVAENVNITMRVLSGETGPSRDVVLLNAGATIFAANRAESMREGVEIARAKIDDGSALAKVHELAELTQRLMRSEVAGVNA